MASLKVAASGLAALAALLVGAQAALAEGPRSSSAPESIVLFSGIDGAKDANYIFQGAIVSLNGNISRDGYQLRLYGGHVDYEYAGPAGRTAGDGFQGDVMLGYKINRPGMWAAAYIGADYQKEKLTPDDPTNRVRGTQVGFKVVADVASLRTEGPVYYSLSGEYSTAFQSYWSRARVGANMSGATFGPEFIALGNQGFDATRAGGFVTFDLPITKRLPLEVTLYAGHQFVAGSSSGGATGIAGGEGTYFGISLVSVF